LTSVMITANVASPRISIAAVKKCPAETIIALSGRALT
jgi:hypothetical protein